jgi:hypothetical protein
MDMIEHNRGKAIFDMPCTYEYQKSYSAIIFLIIKFKIHKIDGCTLLFIQKNVDPIALNSKQAILHYLKHSSRQKYI